MTDVAWVIVILSIGGVGWAYCEWQSYKARRLAAYYEYEKRRLAEEKVELPTVEIPPKGWRYCDTCDKYIHPKLRCNYDHSGNCSASGYSWTRDGTIHPVRGGRQA